MWNFIWLATRSSVLVIGIIVRKLCLLILSPLPRTSRCGIRKCYRGSNDLISHPPGPIKNFPRNLSCLTYITTLVIKSNHLERLPPELGHLVNLVNLDASYNRLRDLPSTVGDLIDMQILVLNNNQICDLPLEMGRLVNIRHLSKCNWWFSLFYSFLSNL